MEKELLHTKYQAGFSLVEVILATSVFVLLATALVGSYLYGQESTMLAGNRAQAVLLAEEGLEASRNIRDALFSNLSNGANGFAISGNQWNFSGASDVVGIFTRSITISSVDANRKSLSCSTSWTQNAQRTGSVALVTYLTNWQGAAPAVSSCSDAAIQQGYGGGTCRQNVTQCTNNGETNIASADVYCTGGPSADTCCAGAGGGGASCSGTVTACTAFVSSPSCSAQAGCSWGGGGSGATTNPSFDTDSTGWTYADWEENANSVSGDRQGSGGNPSGYIRVVVAGKKNQTLSGYWQQSFTTTSNSPTGTVSFDWRVPSYSSTGLTSYYLYVYVESTSGNPVLANYAWRSPVITATTAWASVSNLDISSYIPASGTYYIKVAARGIYDNTNSPGTTIGAFDNIQLNWTGAASCSGTPTPCGSLGDQTSCQAQSVCSWQ